MASSSWVGGLSRVGEYYEGFVKNVDDLPAKHSTETVTTYGIRRSRKIGNTASNKENHDSSVSTLLVTLLLTVTCNLNVLLNCLLANFLPVC